MIMTNEEICRVLQSIGELLELQGENPFKSRAYFNAVATIQTLDSSVQELVQQGTLSSIKGIGKALTQKITELVETGCLAYYEKLQAGIPPDLFEIAALPSLDRRKTGLLHLKLGITTLDDLERACLTGQVAQLRGFHENDQQQLLKDIHAKAKESRLDESKPSLSVQARKRCQHNYSS